MRSTLLAALAATAFTLAACSSPDGAPPTALSEGPAGPSFANGVPNLSAPPDLIVDERATRTNWLVRVEDFAANLCSVQEGGVVPGTHTVLRFSVTTPNIGKGDVFVGSPKAHMDPNGDGDFADQDGLFEFASCHAHFHFKHYATYRLIDASGTEWRAAKAGFCMLDTDPYNTKSGDGAWSYRNCGSISRDGFQGISAGWADTYMFFLAGQYFVLDGGDGQPAVPPGDYIIEVDVNPAYAPNADGTCPLAKDPATGLCHQFAEADYTNNVGRVSITIPSHPGRSGYGPLKGDATEITRETEIEHRGN